MQKVMSFLKSGAFWAGFVAGVLAASAFSKVRNIANPVASKIPGSDAAA
jgi:hypothetical protein